jgi:membrane protein
MEAFFQQADQSGLDVLRRTRWLDLAILERPGLAGVEEAAALAPAATGSGNP